MIEYGEDVLTWQIPAEASIGNQGDGELETDWVRFLG
jgi:hypothetical protein